MSKSLPELHFQRGQLVERISHQRTALAHQTLPLQAALAAADRASASARQATEFAKGNALTLTLGMGLAATVLLLFRPRRMLRLVQRSLLLWRTVRTLRSWLPSQVVAKVLRRYF